VPRIAAGVRASFETMVTTGWTTWPSCSSRSGCSAP